MARHLTEAIIRCLTGHDCWRLHLQCHTPACPCLCQPPPHPYAWWRQRDHRRQQSSAWNWRGQCDCQPVWTALCGLGRDEHLNHVPGCTNPGMPPAEGCMGRLAAVSDACVYSKALHTLLTPAPAQQAVSLFYILLPSSRELPQHRQQALVLLREPCTACRFPHRLLRSACLSLARDGPQCPRT